MPLNGFLDQGGLSYLWGKITGKIATSEANVTAKIPKKTSQLENDSNFAKKTDIPTASTTRPKAPTAYGIVGTGTKYAREDHQHPKQDVKEAEVKWGGGSLKGDVTPIDAAMIPLIGYNKTECAKPAGITVEYSNDAGATWVDYGLSDRGKSNLVSICGDSSVFIGGGTSITQKTLDDQLRITVNAQKCGTYTALKKILIEMSTNGATDTKVLIEKAKGTAPTEFSEVGTYDITGWSGWNSIDIGQVYFGGGTELNMFVLRFTFTIGGLNSGNYKSALQVMHILFLGNTNWGTPSAMARTGHLYTYDVQQNATFPANVSAAAFIGSANGLTSTFDAWSVRDNIASGNNLTTIFSKIRRMFADLKGLAFKDKVDKADLSDAVQTSLTKADSALDDAKTYADTKVGEHNQDTAAHQDIRTAVAGSVRYDAAQPLTDEQKTQARGNINAAPGGFGYGDTLASIDINNDEAAFNSALDALLSGLENYVTKQIRFANYPVGGQKGGTFVGTLYKHDATYAVLYGSSYDGGTIQKRKLAGAWQPWEWVNPPMELGVEYRTTERYLGKPVYCKLVDFGKLPNNTYKDVAHGISNLKWVISVSGESNGDNLIGNMYITYVHVFSTNIRIKTNTDRSGVDASVLIKYTKTTD